MTDATVLSCGKCGKPDATSRCGKCRSVHYCSTDCQRADWPAHKKDCGKPADTELRSKTVPVKQGKGSDNTLERVRQSCAAVAAVASEASVDKEGIQRLCAELDCDAVRAAANDAKTMFPLRFDDLEDEVNFLAVMNLLSFGTGYRTELHEAVGTGAHETLLRGMLGLRLSGHTFDADFLASITPNMVEEAFGIKAKTMRGIPGMPAEVEVEGPLYPYVQAQVKAAQSAGQALKLLRKKSLGRFVLDVLEAFPCCAGTLVDALAEGFSGFADIGVYTPSSRETPGGALDVLFYSKAQILCAELWRRFREEEAKLFNFHDVAQLTVCANPVLLAMLIKLKAITVDASVATAISANQALSRNVEIGLRAVVIAACEEILSAAQAKGQKLSAYELDAYLWGTLGKEEEHRKLDRHVCKDTMFY